MSNSKPNQCRMLLERMKKGERFTQRKALLELSIGRLPSRIFEIKRQGIEVNDRFVEVENQFGEKCRVKEYWIEE